MITITTFHLLPLKHPNQDKRNHTKLAQNIRAHCRIAYETFAIIYADIETARVSLHLAAAHDGLHERLKQFAVLNRRDPAKLVRIKIQIQKRSAHYLTCLTYPHVASDNNAAERSLRHLVLKRKISFGSLCARTAETMAILCSVLLSLKVRGELRSYLAGA